MLQVSGELGSCRLADLDLGGQCTDHARHRIAVKLLHQNSSRLIQKTAAVNIRYARPITFDD